MSENSLKALLIPMSGLLLVVYLLLQRPDYLASTSGLATFIAGEILLAALFKYKKAFFPLLIIVFLCAGTEMPFHSAFSQGRWLVLAAGGLIGIAIYVREADHYFNIFHLLACFCVLSAVVSAFVSQYVAEAQLKAASLLLLFLYAAAGARIAVPRAEPEKFFRGLLIGCEVVTYCASVSYLVFRYEIFGNPNSLGAVMGVVIIPMLLWGVLTAGTSMQRSRLGIALLIAGVLLMSSFARAAIGAAVLSLFLLSVSVREYRLLIKGLAAITVVAACVVLFIPHFSHGPDIDNSQSIGSAYLYKGKQDSGVFGSRRSVWQTTWQSISQNPWFGTGFGTSQVSEDMTKLAYAKHHTDSWVAREHGNSYLEIAEWTGLLGVLPFFLLVGLAATNVWRVFVWLRRSGDVSAAAVPAATIVAAGLFNAMFEDWMFAVGYYLCVFFWAIAFILVDVVPRARVVYAPDVVIPVSGRQFPAVLSSQ